MSEKDYLDNHGELVHRQVHPNFISEEGILSSQAFTPFPKDKGGLSVDRDSVATAEESYNLHVVNKGLKSAGTWIVTVGECEVQELRVYADPLITDPKNLAHCLADFHGMSLSAVKRVGKKLRDCAEKRGSTYSPAD